MGALAHERNNQAMELAALMARSTLYVTFTPIHNPDRGEALSEQALILAQKLEDQEAEARISWNLSNFYLFTGKSASKSLTYGERSLALARQLNLHEQIAFTLNDLGLS